MLCRSFILVTLVFLCAAPACADEPTYWNDIRPILRRNCTVCHSTKNVNELDVSGGLALDNYQAVVKGSKKPVIVPGKSKESHLVQLVQTKDEAKRMPKDASPLSQETIDLLGRWIDAGAKEGTAPDTVAGSQPTTAPKRVKHLDVVLGTNATPPQGFFAEAKPGRMELALQVGPLAPATAVVFSPDGKLLATGCYGRVTIWDLALGKPVKVLTNVLGAVNDIRFSPKGKLMAVAGGQPSAKGDLRIYNTADWQLLGTLGGHQDVVFAVAFSPDGKRLASASFDKTVRVWDIATHKQELELTNHSDFVYSVAFSPDGKWLVSSSKDRSVKMFDAATGKSLLTFSGLDQDVLCVAISPDGKNVVSSGFQTSIYWWNPQTAERIRAQGGHGVAVHELTFSKDGKVLVSAGADGTVRLWNGSTGAAIKSLSVGGVVYAMAISPDGKQVASGGFDGLVRLWDVESGRQLVSLLSLPSVDDKPAWLTVTPEGYGTAAEELKPQVQWRLAGQAVAADVAWKSLGQPDVVLKAFRGEALPAAKFEK